jgi:hypothetical protein
VISIKPLKNVDFGTNNASEDETYHSDVTLDDNIMVKRGVGGKLNSLLKPVRITDTHFATHTQK